MYRGTPPIRNQPVLGHYRGTPSLGPAYGLGRRPTVDYMYRGTPLITNHPALGPYRGASLIRDRRPLGPYSRTIRRAL